VSVERTWTVGLSLVAAEETRASVLGAQACKAQRPSGVYLQLPVRPASAPAFCLAICDARGQRDLNTGMRSGCTFIDVICAL
jgi:hypothetical protein